MTLSEAKEIAKTIHEYVEEKSQEPTGNQNCLLCVWCSEARFRGFRVLPRPVYSPRDSIFKHHEHGLDIVHDAVKESISSIDDIKKKCVNDARYYCHINWKDSKGGHEFLLIVIDDGIYVMDSQANIVAPITSENGEYYFNDINWDNSFIARIDDKKLNKSLLFRENSMIKVLPWDEEADVKFLIDNGMVSSELTLPEGISIRKATSDDIEYVYECELETSDQEEIQKQEKRDEVMKDAKDSIEHTQIIMRGSNKIGIYQAYATNQYGMKQEPYDWWYIAEIYIEPAYRSMGIGSALIKRDIEIHGKIMLHVLLSNKRAIKLYESLGFEKDQENGYGGLIMRIDKSKMIKEAYEHNYSGDMKLPDGVGFRRATENDVSDIYTWRLEAIAKRLRDNEQAKQYVMDDTKRHLNDAYIITYNGKDVGVYVGYKIDDGWWYISTIHILKEYRGQGIGSAIMRRDCACRNKICLRVDPHNTRARKFYKSLGFRVTDKSNKASYVMRYEKGKRPRRVQESFMDEYDPFENNNISNDVKDIIINTGIYGTYLNIFDDEELLWMSTEDLPDSITFNPNVTYMSKSYENVQVELLTLLDIAKNIQSEMDSSKNSVFSFKIGTIDIPSVGKKSILVDSETGNIYVDKKGSKFKISDNIKNLLNKSVQESFVQEQYFYEHGKKLYFHCSRDGNLDGQIFKPRVPEYIERYNPEDTGFENSTTPRICLAPTIEGCLNGIAVNMPRISPLAFDRVYVYTPEKPFNEYKHKTNKELVRDKDVYDANITDEVWILEPVRMKLYGIIQVDQCSNVKKKKAVETPSGKYEKRNVFKYKWHWLVKPKVLDKATKFNYDPKQVCELLLMDLPKFKYGLIKDGRLSITNNSEADYDKYWKMHTPEEVDEAGGGNCYDITEYEAGFLDAYGVPFKKYFISALTPDGKKHATHTFIVVKISDKYKYIEGAFKRVIDEIGYSKDFDKLNDIFDYIVECMVEYDNVDEYQFGVFDYTDHTPTKGVSIKKFEDYVTTNGENIYEGTKSKKK